MNGAAPYRGQPLVVLIVLIGGWIAMRAILWDAGAVQQPLAIDPPPGPALAGGRAKAIDPEPSAPNGPERAFAPVRAPFPVAPLSTPAIAPAMRQIAAPGRMLEPWPPLPAARPTITPPMASRPVPVPTSAAHQIMWMAAVANLPLPPGLLLRSAAAKGPARHDRHDRQVDRRWSADGWLLLRRGGSPSAGGFSPPSYGASQAGAVARYRLVPQSRHRPALYLRASAALNGSDEREAAVGVSARPIARLAVTLAAEARITTGPGGTRVRPAAFAHTELAPVDLPLGARAEFYGQAGYVGGDFASGFADGQLRVDRHVAQIGRGELRAGGGAWGGAQKGASRLDIGPTAMLGMPMGASGGARLGLDWRFRVVGNAVPSSGPALTLSAGF